MTPHTSCDDWYWGYFGDPDVDAAFDRFWANGDGLQDAFAAMWRHVAERLWQVPAVVAFEIMNEPYPGSADPAGWARDVLPPFAERMAQAIRERAPGALVVVEPSGRDATDGRTDLPRPVADGAVFSMHYYAASVFLLGPDAATYDTLADLRPWGELRDEWALPLLVGELGCKTGSAGGGRYLAANFDALDAYRLHGTAWEYSTTHDDWNHEALSVTRYGGEETPSVAALVRAYPRAVAGRLRSFRFDAASLRGTLELTAAPGISEIVAPARLYPAGVEAALAGVAGRTSWDAPSQLLLVETSEPGEAVVTFGPR